MDKIQKAQDLADMLLDEMEIKQVGGDKGALKDEPESIKKSEDDLEDYVEMKESDELLEDEVVEEGLFKNKNNPARKNSFNDLYKKGMKRLKDGPPKKKVKEEAQISSMVDNLATYLGEASLGAKIQRGIARNDKNYEEGNDMDPTAKANAKKRKEEKTVKEGILPYKKVSRDIEQIKDHELGRRGFENSYGGNTKSKWGPQNKKREYMTKKMNDYKKKMIDKPMDSFKKKHNIKEADQVATAQQKNTLFDKLERVVKDSGKLKPTITTEPTTEGSLKNIQDWGKKIMMGKRKKGLKITQKRDKALKDTAEG
jgi:hypothetical protein